jgi:hypothetical protein
VKFLSGRAVATLLLATGILSALTLACSGPDPQAGLDAGFKGGNRPAPPTEPKDAGGGVVDAAPMKKTPSPEGPIGSAEYEPPGAGEQIKTLTQGHTGKMDAPPLDPKDPDTDCFRCHDPTVAMPKVKPKFLTAGMVFSGGPTSLTPAPNVEVWIKDAKGKKKFYTGADGTFIVPLDAGVVAPFNVALRSATDLEEMSGLVPLAPKKYAGCAGGDCHNGGNGAKPLLHIQ